jgi:hypothetical protein
MNETFLIFAITTKPVIACIKVTDMDITDRAIQVGGAREGQSFVLKV